MWHLAEGNRWPHSFFLCSFCALFTPLWTGLQSENVGNRCFHMDCETYQLHCARRLTQSDCCSDLGCPGSSRVLAEMRVSLRWKLSVVSWKLMIVKATFSLEQMWKPWNDRACWPWLNALKVIWDMSYIMARVSEGTRSEEQGMSGCGLDKTVCGQCSRDTTKAGRDHWRKPRMVKWASVVGPWEEKKNKKKKGHAFWVKCWLVNKGLE